MASSFHTLACHICNFWLLHNVCLCVFVCSFVHACVRAKFIKFPLKNIMFNPSSVSARHFWIPNSNWTQNYAISTHGHSQTALYGVLFSKPSQKPPSMDMLNPFCIILMGWGVLATTFRLNRDSRYTRASFVSIRAKRFPETHNYNYTKYVFPSPTAL